MVLAPVHGGLDLFHIALFATREATLTTVESFCMEGIMAMGEPTIAEFSRMMQILSLIHI